jgi:hypothetical protein
MIAERPIYESKQCTDMRKGFSPDTIAGKDPRSIKPGNMDVPSEFSQVRLISMLLTW